MIAIDVLTVVAGNLPHVLSLLFSEAVKSNMTPTEWELLVHHLRGGGGGGGGGGQVQEQLFPAAIKVSLVCLYYLLSAQILHVQYMNVHVRVVTISPSLLTTY